MDASLSLEPSSPVSVQTHTVPGAHPKIRISVNRYALSSPPNTKAPLRVILFNHATGMFKELYNPVIFNLLRMNPNERILCYSMDARNHGDSALHNYDGVSGELLFDEEADGESLQVIFKYTGDLDHITPKNTKTIIPQFDCYVAKAGSMSTIVQKSQYTAIPKPTNDSTSWWVSALEGLKVIEWIIRSENIQQPVLFHVVGHSFGGCLAFMMEYLLNHGNGGDAEGERLLDYINQVRRGDGRFFESVYAIEPVIAPLEYYEEFRTGRGKEYREGLDLVLSPGLADIAERRRGVFTDRNHATKSLLSKPFFEGWHPKNLELFMKHGLYEAVNKDGVKEIRLKCHPRQEGATFRGQGAMRMFSLLDKITTTSRVISGSESDANFPFDFADGEDEGLKELCKDQAIARKVKNGEHDLVDGGGHMVTMEKPVELSKDLSNFLFRNAAKKLPTGAQNRTMFKL